MAWALDDATIGGIGLLRDTGAELLEQATPLVETAAEKTTDALGGLSEPLSKLLPGQVGTRKGHTF